MTKEQMRRQAQALIEWLNEECEVIPLVKRIQDMTGIPASLQCLILLNYLLFQAVTGGLSKEIAILVGTVYPCLKSI